MKKCQVFDLCSGKSGSGVIVILQGTTATCSVAAEEDANHWTHSQCPRNKTGMKHVFVYVMKIRMEKICMGVGISHKYYNIT